MPPRSPGGHGARRSAPRPRPSAATHNSPDPDNGEQLAALVGALPGQPRYLTDPAIAEHIAAFVAAAPTMTDDQCRKLSRLLRTNRCIIDRQSTIDTDRRNNGGRRRKAA